MSESILDPWPPLNPAEKYLLEKYAGRKLTDEEAHRLLRDAKIEAAFNRWLADKEKDGSEV